ncbi:hypothetical protein WDW89_14370 [Deltaproteobacteria bacterium TL4]
MAEEEKTIHPLTERILNNVDPEVYKSMSKEQRIEIEQAIDSFWNKSKFHMVDLRGVIPLTSIYFVFLMGNDRRKKDKAQLAQRARTPRSKQILSLMIVFMCIACIVLVSLNLFLLFPTLYNLITPKSF